MLAFHSGHKNREHLHFWGGYFGALPTTCGAGSFQALAPVQDAWASWPPLVAKAEVRGSECSAGGCGDAFSTVPEDSVD